MVLKWPGISTWYLYQRLLMLLCKMLSWWLISWKNAIFPPLSPQLWMGSISFVCAIVNDDMLSEEWEEAIFHQCNSLLWLLVQFKREINQLVDFTVHTRFFSNKNVKQHLSWSLSLGKIVWMEFLFRLYSALCSWQFRCSTSTNLSFLKLLNETCVTFCCKTFWN